MKTNLLPMVQKLIIGLTMFCSIQASAQKAGGNGGDPNELATFIGLNGELLDSWYSVRMDLIQGFLTDKYIELNLNGIDPIRFKKTMVRTLRNTKVTWDNRKIIVDGTPRPCENFKDAQGFKRIHCNQTKYASTMKNYDAEAQYKMIAHEYLGAGGYEPNRYGVSDYPLSSQIASGLSSVTVKRWAVKLEGTAPSAPSKCGPEYFKIPEFQAKISQFTEVIKKHLNNSELFKKDNVVISSSAPTLIKQTASDHTYYLAIDNILLSNGVKINYTGHNYGEDFATSTYLVVKRVPEKKDDFGRVVAPAYCKPYLLYTPFSDATVTNEKGDLVAEVHLDFNENMSIPWDNYNN